MECLKEAHGKVPILFKHPYGYVEPGVEPMPKICPIALQLILYQISPFWNQYNFKTQNLLQFIYLEWELPNPIGLNSLGYKVVGNKGSINLVLKKLVKRGLWVRLLDWQLTALLHISVSVRPRLLQIWECLCTLFLCIAYKKVAMHDFLHQWPKWRHVRCRQRMIAANHCYRRHILSACLLCF